jgi:negative regulator of flagellin synthesis FlgM
MQISGNFSVSGVDTARAAARSNAPEAASPTAPPAIATPVDKLDLSPEALGIQASSQPTETFRADKVASLRQAIAQGNYDTDERMSAALDSFLDKLG